MFNIFEDIENQPFSYDNYDNNECKSFFPFEHDLLNEAYINSNSFSLNSNDYKDLYYKRPLSPPKIELEEKEEEKKTPKENEKENFNKEIERTKTTSYKTLLPVFNKENEKEKIFEIKKKKKLYLGRKRKNHSPSNDTDNGNDKVHTKNKKDDMLTKLKRNSYNNSVECVNYNLSISENEKLKSIKLKKIDNSVITVSKKEENQALFKTEIKDLFSNKISTKFIHEDPDYNKKKINYILKQNDKKINDILHKTFDDMIEIYVDKNKEVIPGFTKLKDDKKFLEKNNDEKYIKLFKEFCFNYKENIDKIYPRRKRKSN